MVKLIEIKLNSAYSNDILR